MENPTQEELAKWHRWFAIEANNQAWALAEKPDRTREDDDDLLHLAHAAAWHWAQGGTELHRARADLLVAQAHAVHGLGETARRFVERSADVLSRHDSPDWERALLEGIRAHAAWASGRTEEYRQLYRRAQELVRIITNDEDRKIVEASFSQVPAP